MKKLAISLIVGASLVISSSAFALQSMSADSMKAATGQAGVTIAVDDLFIESWVGATTYTDVDGTDGSVTISEKHTVESYNGINGWNGAFAITSTGVGLAEGTIDAAAFDRKNIAEKGFGSPFIIDVGNCAVLAAGTPNSLTIAGVVIGLPTLEIITSSATYSVSANIQGWECQIN